MLRLLSIAAASAAVFAIAAVAQSGVISDYAPTRQVAGVIRICGSPQMGDLLKLYEDGFEKLQPGVRFESDLQSTLTAVRGVTSGHAEIGLLGREIWPAEEQAFASTRGHDPAVIDIATGSYDVPKATFALMVFAPRTNPIAHLSATQLERIFSSTGDPIRTWGDLGLRGEWKSRPVHLYGFTVDNDKSQIFSRLIFTHGAAWNPALHQFANTTGPAPVDAGELILRAVADDPDAIGISNVHYATPGVRPLALSTAAHPAPIVPTRENVANRSYPLTRSVYMIAELDHAQPAVVEFLRFVLSRQGEQAVMQEGNYLPLPSEIALKQLRQLPATAP